MTRRNNDETRENFEFSYDNASLTADATVKVFKVRKRARIVRVEHVSPTGLAADAANYFNLKLLNVTDTNKVIANWSTETGQEGSLTANAFEVFTQGADVQADADDVLALFLDKTGTATLPAGRTIVHGEYL